MVKVVSLFEDCLEPRAVDGGFLESMVDGSIQALDTTKNELIQCAKLTPN